MTVYCSKCGYIINESEFMVAGQKQIPYTIFRGNLICQDCDKEDKK
jgi:hypothetical protein